VRMIKAAIVFMTFAFIYTIIFYTVTPAVDMLVNAFADNIDTSGWSSQAVSTYNTIIMFTRYGWFWSCVLSFISTAIWYYLYPYREEVLTREYA